MSLRRMEALKQEMRVAKCRKDGHDVPVFSWYDLRSTRATRCRRCGAAARPKIDWSGHP